MKIFTKMSSLSSAYKSLVLLFAFLFVWTACSDQSEVNTPGPQASSSATIDPSTAGATSKSFPVSTVTLSDGSNYSVASNVTWYGSTTTWTYTITTVDNAKNISHVNFYGFKNCFWDNLNSSEGLVLVKEPTSTGCFAVDTDVIKYTPANESEQRSLTFSWTFNSALAVDESAGSVYVKASNRCESVTIPGPSCTELSISGKVEKKICNDALTSVVPAEGVTVTAQQGTQTTLTATTAADGTYSFSNLGGEWIISIPDADAVKVAAGPDNGSSNFLFDTRVNGSCAQVVGSAKVINCVDENKRTQAYQNADVNFNTQTAATQTGTNGDYKFSNVSVGSHTITIGGVSKTISVGSEDGVYTVDEIVVDNRPNGSCAMIVGTTIIMECFQQSSRTNPYVGVTATCEHQSCTTLAPDGSFRFMNASAMTHTITIDGVTKSVNVTADEGIFNVGEILVDKTNGGVCGSGPVECSLSQGYWFAKPQAVWPAGEVTIGGKKYTQAEGKAIWNTSNSRGLLNAKAAFLQASAIKLSKVEPTASVWADVQIIENYLASIAKLAPGSIPGNSRTGANANAGAAAGRIGNWINANHCAE
jgi:hypothetical protein